MARTSEQSAAPPETKAGHTPGPWEYVASTEHHGPYVVSEFGSTICDCYTMSNPRDWSIRNGGTSKPVLFLHEMADPNACLIAAAPDLLAALEAIFHADNAPLVMSDSHSQKLMDDARAAILKATEDAA